MRKLALVLATSIVLAAACSSSSGTQQPAGTGGGVPTPAASPGGGGSYWSGNGSANVTIGGTTVTVSPGGCYDGGSLGVDFRFGAWENPTTSDWVMGIAHQDGSKPAAITGGVGGKLFVLGADVTATIGADGKGTFAGTDSTGGNGKITATFSCK